MSYVNQDFKAGNTSWLNAQIATTVYFPDDTNYTFKSYVRMSVNRTANYNVYHGIGKHNQGYIKLPKGYTFSVTMPVTSQDVQIMRSLFHSEAIFDFEYLDAQSANIDVEAVEFKLMKEKLIDCVLTSMNDSYEVEGIPQVVFNGTALRNDFVATIDHNYTDVNYADNQTQLNAADIHLTGMINTGYWDYAPTPTGLS